MSATSGSVSTATRAEAGGTPTQTTIKPRIGIFGLALSGLGAVGIITSIAAQTFAIDHGANQKPIDANNITTIWSILIGAGLLALGVILWFHFGSVSGEYRYLWVYGLAFSSYILATIALYMSTIQVIVRETNS
jgi:hypothetical protein